MTKKPQNIEAAAPEGVDMDHIKEIMGPLPSESGVVPDDKTVEENQPVPNEELNAEPVTSPIVSKSNKAISAAAEEVNESLKAMNDGLKDPALDEVAIAQPLNAEEKVFARPEWLDSMEGPEDGAALVVGEGVVADDPKIMDAVADIVAHESDTVLEAEDKERSIEAGEVAKQKQGAGQWIKNMWSKPLIRWTIILIILALLIGTAVYPASRYYILNNTGARSSLSISIVDSGTLQPLKNVTVSISSVSAETDSKGVARLEHIRLGDSTMQISKRAFATITQHLVIGWGSNPQGQQRLEASGTQYNFIVTDFLSGKPIVKAEVTSGYGNAVSDKDGKIVLTLDTRGKADNDELSIQVVAANYRSETVKIMASNKETSSIKLVTARKDVFMSNRSGKYDMFTIDIDGKNEKKIVPGTGVERPDMDLAVQQNSDTVAYVATRENAHNADGYLLSTLYTVDTKTGTLSKIDQSEQIQLVGWSSDGHLVYVKIAAGASGANPKRYRLITVNTKNSSETKEIATANAFNDVVMAGDKVLYAPSNALGDNPNPGMFIVSADGNGSVTVTSKETFNIFRTDYSTVTINSSGTYYTYKIGAAPNTLTPITAPTTINRLYIDNFANNKSLWLDNKDGQSILLSFDKSAQKDTTLVTQSGIKLPIFWLNETDAVFRINDGKQTADYVVSANGGEAKRIQDLSDVAGIGRWYYY